MLKKKKGRIVPTESKQPVDEYVQPEAISFDGTESVQELFLKLTSQTCPHFTGKSPERRIREHDLYGESLKALGGRLDRYGNIHILVGDRQPTTLFTCHLDTADHGMNGVPVKHVIGPNFITTTGFSLLGADNKGGMTVMLKMIKAGVHGHYAFFLGEELGCLGSRWASQYLDWDGYKRAIAFDREGYDSVITRQVTGKCCSDKFANALADQLNSRMYGELEMRQHQAGELEIQLYKPDPTGRLTDTAMFVWGISECTNIGAGSFFSHQDREVQNIRFLERLVDAAIQIEWDALPTVRKIYR